MEKTNEILTIAGKRVEVRHCKQYYCDKCCLDDVVRCYPKGPCVEYNKDGLHAYFVPAKEIEGISQKVTLIPSNEDEAAENSEIIFSADGELTIYSFVGAPRWWATIREAEEALSVFKAGMLAERERLMKEAEVIEGVVCGRVADHINIKVEGGDYLTPRGVMHIVADKSKYEIGDKVKLIILK